MNRLAALFEREREWSPPGDFHVLYGECGWFLVTAETARAIERQLDRRWPPRWITFRDLVGSHLRVRSSLIHGLYESTSAQRAAERALDRMRRAEEQADARPWEE